MLAAMHGKITCVEKLIQAGANVCQYRKFLIEKNTHPQTYNVCVSKIVEVKYDGDIVQNLLDFDV